MSPAALCIRTSMRSSVFSIPPSRWMKSMCHEVRRNSPSVAACSPIRSCIATASRIAASSAARSAPTSISPAACAARARSRAGGRSRLPTWSARNGGSARERRRGRHGGKASHGPVDLRRHKRPSRTDPVPRARRTVRRGPGPRDVGARTAAGTGWRPPAAWSRLERHRHREADTVDDAQLRHRITELVEEEHHLERAHAGRSPVRRRALPPRRPRRGARPHLGPAAPPRGPPPGRAGPRRRAGAVGVGGRGVPAVSGLASEPMSQRACAKR